MLKTEKKRGVPDPGKYDQPSLIGKDKKGGNGMLKSTAEKYCGFIEDAKVASLKVPRPGHLPANARTSSIARTNAFRSRMVRCIFANTENTGKPKRGSCWVQ